MRPQRGSPVIYNDLIYVVSSRGKLVAFDLAGNRGSSVAIAFKPLATPAIDQGRLFVGGDDGKFHCLDLGTGKEIWSYDLKTIDFSPAAVYGSNVIFQSASDRVMALDVETGAWRWEYQHLRIDDLAVRGMASPVIKDGVAYVGLSSGFVAAMDAQTGRLIWKKRVFQGEQFKDVDAPVQVDDTSVYAVSDAGDLAALSRKTGNVFWTYQAGGMAGLALDGDNLYLATDEAELIALDKITGKPAWSTKLLAGRAKLSFLNLPTAPRMIGPEIVTVSRDGQIFFLDKSTGKIEARHHYHTETASPAISVPGGGVLFCDNKGIVRYWRQPASITD
ncbi:MAG TPA: PQQ-binding-like beta-propeller repeat protein [bacterium]|nr:PQQ-binding-like beta-propeller repeat protein [bacterium]